MLREVSTFVLLFLGLSLQAQYPTLKSYQKEVEIAESQKDWSAAYNYYTKMIEFDQKPEFYHYKAAQMALNMKAYITADRHLAHLDSLDLGEGYENIDYYRGVAAHHTGKYDQAIVYYNLYISEMEEENPLVEDARIRIESADWANFQKKDTLVDILHLGESINSPYSDFGATTLGEKDFIYSTDRVLIQKDNYKSKRKISHLYYSEDGEHSTQMSGEINKPNQHTSNTTMTPDGKTIYYTLCEFLENSTDIRCDIYKRSFDKDSMRYGPEEKLPNPINIEGYTTTQPNIGMLQDSQWVLFFASDRPGGKGETDIWYSPINKQGFFETPVNLEYINTEKAEWSPFFHHLDNTLFFSSDGLLGFGSLDVFKADWNGAETSDPSNLGAPTNSSYDDVYYALKEDGYSAYLASNRDGSYFIDSELEACCFDLYKVKYIPPPMDLLVSVFDDFDSVEISSSIVTLIDAETGATIGQAQGMAPQDYMFKIQHFKNYRLVAQKEGYLPDTLDFNTNDERGVEILEKQLYLPKVVPLLATLWDENTGEPILGGIVKLYETNGEDKILLAETSNALNNEYHFSLGRGKSYELFGTKSLYDTAMVLISKIETTPGDSVIKRIDLVQLAIRNLEKVFPLILYFDNDIPDPGTKRSTTDKIYHDTYNEYMAREQEFIANYTKNLGGSDYGKTAEEKVKSFFTDEVEHGYNKLNYFMEQLLGVLQGGLLVEVSIKGYTSPLAQGDYNLALGRRRVQCLKNEFLDWNGGILMEYAKIGKLVLKEISFGETKAPIGLSDSAFDKRNSVYSPLASKERRVEVIAVRRMAREANVNQ